MDYQNISNNTYNEANILKSKDKFANIKSYYFLRELFNILEMKKSLEIIKYNKNIKIRLNINIKDYKKYLETYSSIEIEIIPEENEYGKFINISPGDSYYHIYFNNNKEEIKRNYFNKEDNVTYIKIIIDHQINHFCNLFSEMSCIKSVNFKKFYRNNIIDMSSMFWKCSSLKEINLSNFNTNNVTNMSYMFCRCDSLKELDLSKFNTDNVTDMRGMFSICSSLEKINVSHFNTKKVIDMTYMFCNCLSLKEIDISNFNISEKTKIKTMFFGLPNKLKKIIKNQIKNISEEVFEEDELHITY